eukprot:TRINITY_DN4473_c1_g3_i1.p1 TRINITY_DN4473_c1_g3~~TRINITY_DN4473_c1_g3_i1.p1  ORF type:complete len:497 (+),score=120.43 TRINITY_DN4473_c1_g3_i1:77-1492(+)
MAFLSFCSLRRIASGTSSVATTTRNRLGAAASSSSSSSSSSFSTLSRLSVSASSSGVLRGYDSRRQQFANTHNATRTALQEQHPHHVRLAASLSFPSSLIQKRWLHARVASTTSTTPTKRGGDKKRHGRLPKTHTLVSAASCRGKHLSKDMTPWDEAGDCGEDSLFIAPTVVGVADGVGGWSEVGVDSALFSRRLMHNAHRFAETEQLFDPYEILEKSYEQIVTKKEVEAGSATSCIVSLVEATDEQHATTTAATTASAKAEPVHLEIRAANLGDSGFVVIRKNKGNCEVVYRSKEQQAEFNAPYQLAMIPAGMRGCYSNSPSDADLIHLEAKEGDFIITGTDGLFDNVYDEQIVTLVEHILETHSTHAHQQHQRPNHPNDHHRPHHHHPPHSPAGHERTAELCQKIAVALLDKAREGASNESWESPFARNARTQGRFFYRGGKWDDITIIVSTVCQTPTSSPSTAAASTS